ncbi:glycerophosphodiester phosphodiesterase [Rubritalea tangerina]|uniref:Glycerophosphodiester phosphodiesterase n=1 Tax=Rubritalea tangerina TaxID=430798 RepID=A0ABW4ZE03_9BACT
MNEKLPLMVIGHRGCVGRAAENTLAAVKLAIEQGCRWVEVDVHLLGERLVVIHDERVDRTTDGVGCIGDLGLDRLRELDAGGGEKVPFIEEVLDVCEGKVGVNIELKGKGVAEAVVNMLEGRRWEDEVIVSSFDWEMLKRVREMHDSVPIAVLFSKAREWEGAIQQALSLGARWVNPSLRALDKGWVRYAQGEGLMVAVYTVRGTGDLRKVIDSEADACFVDDPKMVMEALWNGYDMDG